ncbi:MAG: 1-(5-phosphoribosyl)-5-[(5-phosphoribosylamino)methylideneamino]imidazole-4-carboxamide isomerase [Ignavibacteriaceae bacterium]
MLIIPSIDIYENKIVRLTKGDFDNITYYKNTPLKQARLYESFGFKLVHVVDLIGAKKGKLSILETVEKIKKETQLKIQFGGGIRDVKSAMEVFNAGIDYAIIGSLSVKNKNEFELIIKEFSDKKIICAVDFLNGIVKVSGWLEETSLSVFDHIKYCSGLGIKKFICTDISKDGMLTGTNIYLYKRILAKYPNIKLVASGGVKDIEDVKKLKLLNFFGVIIGKAIYEDKIDLKELSEIAE